MKKEKNTTPGEELYMSPSRKMKLVGMMAVYAAVLGAAAGFIVWTLIKILDVSTNYIWTVIPQNIIDTNLYTAAVCIIGGLIIGIYQRWYGVYPDTVDEIFSKLKRTGTYPYKDLSVIFIAALLPLVFGGSIGPEAGLAGIITALCCRAGSLLKYKKDEVRELAKSGIAATLGVVFNAPLFGLVNNFEHQPDEKKRFFSPKEFKFSKLLIYAAGIAGGFAVIHGLKKLLGGGLGLPRLGMEGQITAADWKWFLLYVACGIALGFLYMAFSHLTERLAEPLKDKRILSCLIAGICLALLGVMSPVNLFSGESQLTELVSNWQTIPVMILILTAVTKLLATSICISFGWKGGHIFPIIYCGISLGFGLAALTGALPIFAVAAAVAAEYGYIMKKPLTVVAILFICFPLRLVVPLAAAAYIASFIPSPWDKAQKKPADTPEAA